MPMLHPYPSGPLAYECTENTREHPPITELWEGAERVGQLQFLYKQSSIKFNQFHTSLTYALLQNLILYKKNLKILDMFVSQSLLILEAFEVAGFYIT